MKRLLWVPVMALVLGIALLNGCGEKTDQAAQKAKEQIQEAAETAGAWTKDQMNNYIGEMKEQLGNLDSQLEEFNAKAEGLDDAAKEKYQEQLAALDEKKDAVAKKMDELTTASGDAWEKAKEELDKLMAELAQLYENIKKEFSAT